jgi:dTMP kinase
LEAESLVFVVIDGLDASGKSTQGISLYVRMKSRGRSACLRIHPSEDNFFGVKTKEFLYLRGKNAHLAAAFFYMFDVLRSILLYSWRKYDYVIFVRYLIGTSYLPSPLFTVAYYFFASLVPTSDFMFFLDVTPKEAYRRILQTRKRQEMFETLEELEVIRRRAFSLALRGKWKIIDADSPVGDIEKEISKFLSLGLNRM